MENAGYVVTGWVITGAALATYALAIVRRTRRASRFEDGRSASAPDSELA